MTRLFAVIALICCGAIEAHAQAPSGNESTIASFDPGQPVAPISGVEGNGWKVGEGTVLLPVIGLETGVINNVFYENNGPATSGVLRIMAQIGMGSLTNARLRTGANPDAVTPEGEEAPQGDFEYRTDLRLSYDQMLSGNDAVSGTGGLGVGASLKGTVNPAGTWAFGFSDEFRRLIRAANFETDANTNRDLNNLALRVKYQPQTSKFSGQLYYLNTVDLFERGNQDFADRMLNRIGLRPAFRWLPQTQFFVDVSQGFQGGLGSASMKASSYPFTALGGVATLLTAKTSLNLQAGYTNGFYSAGPSYGSVTAGASFGYRYSPLGRAVLTYDLAYEDSVNANFYRDHVIRLWVHQLFAPFELSVQPEVHFRRYEGTIIPGVGGATTRDDVIFSLVAGMQYNFRNWLAATVNYHLTAVGTSFSYMTDGIVDDPGFVRHELLVGMRAAL
ncbi:MAG: hypothetical protein IPQ07_33895 [Myxococcales bacterium]|nr:hypothetical protein [Myxococcales bacterium]